MKHRITKGRSMHTCSRDPSGIEKNTEAVELLTHFLRPKVYLPKVSRLLYWIIYLLFSDNRKHIIKY